MDVITALSERRAVKPEFSPEKVIFGRENP